MSIRRACLVVLVLALGCSTRRESGRWEAAADATTVRETRTGAVIGTAGRYGGHAWLGIPYAAPPVGERRWRAPEPAARWTGTWQGLTFASPCAQLASPFGGITNVPAGRPTGAEDCLYLNVFAPAFPDARVPTGTNRLPVMVWIHGGGNSIGHAGFFDGSKLATTQDVVVVTINYRLGPFGWFRHAALRAGATSEAERSGNFALLDQIAALAWVRDNVAAFGGDPGNVTIFGESAGGEDVLLLLVAPGARGLFHRAIAQSSGMRTASPEEAEHLHDDAVPGHVRSAGELVLDLMVRDETAKDRDAAKAAAARMSAADVARYLRTRSTTQVLDAAAPGNLTGMLDIPMVFPDGTVLPQAPIFDAIGRPGAYADVPIMLGTTRDETKLFLIGNPAMVRQFLWLVPRARDPENYAVSAEYGSKMWKAAAVDEPAIRLRKLSPRVFAYRFDWDEEPTLLGSDFSTLLGAAHGMEVPFVFGHFDIGRRANVMWTRENAPGRETLSAAMMSYWAAFAATGDPGRGRHGEQPPWPAWDDTTEASPRFMVLDTPAGGGLRMASDYLTKDRVVAQIAADPRLPDARDKCERLRELAVYSGRFTREDYARIATCSAFPLDAYPWKS